MDTDYSYTPEELWAPINITGTKDNMTRYCDSVFLHLGYDQPPPDGWSASIEILAITCYLAISVFIWHNVYYYLWKQKRYQLYSMSLFYLAVQLVIATRLIQAILLLNLFFYDYFVFMAG